MLVPALVSLRVLYVEDNPADAYLLDFSLNAESPPSFDLTILEDGEKALQFISSKPFKPDLIILDIGIPKVDGLTVLAALRADPQFNCIPVLVFVEPNTPNSKRAGELKADLCVAKPSDLEGFAHVRQAIQSLCPFQTEPLAAGA